MKKLFYLVLFLAFFTLLTDLNAQISWESTGGPFGGSVRGIVEEPNGNILAITSGAVYRSTNYGLNWNKLTFEGFSPLKVYYYDDNTVFVLSEFNEGNRNEIYRSDDYLATCQLKNSGMENTGINSLYFSTDGKLYANTFDGIYVSTDKGDNWVQTYSIQEADNWISNCAVNSKGDIFAGTLVGLFRSTDNGSSWIMLNDDEQELETNIENILINSKDTIFITTPYGLYRSYDNGDTWEHLVNDLPESNVGFILLINDEELLVGSAWFGIYHSTNSGDDWTMINESGGSGAILLENGNVFIATINGILFADNLSGNWEYKNAGINELGIASILINKTNSANKDNIFVGDDNGAVHRSTDGGNSWTYLYKTHGAGVSSMVIGTDESIYAGTIWGGVYRSTDNGETWESKNNGLDDPDVRALTIDKNGNLYAGTFSKIYKSTDKGDTWTTCFFQNQSIQCSSLVVNSRNLLFAGTITYGPVRSTNNGLSWTQITNGMQQAVKFITVNKQDELFAVTATNDLYTSINDGNSWSLVKSNMGIQSVFVMNDIDLLAAVDLDHEDIGVYLSTDKGLNWAPVKEGFGNNLVYSFDNNSGGYIYAATSRGVYRTTASVVPVEEGIETNSIISISPNPASDFAEINLLLNQNSLVTITLLDVLGNKIMNVFEGICESGANEYKVSTNNLLQRLYYVNINIGNKCFIKPIVIIR
ncbi:MAG: T9SS type A sorting domain-containing protein [bacterium]